MLPRQLIAGIVFAILLMVGLGVKFIAGIDQDEWDAPWALLYAGLLLTAMVATFYDRRPFGRRHPQRIVSMEQDQPGLLERSFGEIHYRWAIAKLTFLIMNAVSLLGVLFTHFFVWPMEFWDGAAIVTGVSTASAIFAFIFKRIPDVDFDF